MSDIENKIEKYFHENIIALKKLNSLVVKDIASSRHILSDKIYDYISLLLSNHSSFTILEKMLNEYLYNTSITKSEKEYLINKLYSHSGSLRDQPYIDVPEAVDSKSLVEFEQEYLYSVGGFLVGLAADYPFEDESFRAKCWEAAKGSSDPMILVFLKKHINKLAGSYQRECSTIVKKYLKRRLSVKLLYPIIDMHYYLMLTSKEDFEKRIGREAYIEKIESDITEICTRLLERNFEDKSEDEINDYICDMLRSKNHNVSDQTRSGLSMSKFSSGEIDLMIRDDRGLPVTIIEALKLKNISIKGKNDYWVDHLIKLVDNYDNLGLLNKYLIVYCFTNDFKKFQHKYGSFLSVARERDDLEDLKLDSVGRIRGPYGKDISNLVYVSTFHRVNGVYQKVTHFLINLKNQY